MSVLPLSARAAAESLLVMVPPVGLEPGVQQVLQQLREAAQAKQLCRLRYRDAAELRTERHVRPLGVFYWGKVWTLAAWCEARQDFRSFRIDRIENLHRLGHFADEPGKTLSDLLRQEEAAGHYQKEST